MQRSWSVLSSKWLAKTHQVHQQDQATHPIKTSTNIRLLLWNELAISWLLYTNLQNKTLCWLPCMNLQNKTHYRRFTPFARSQKSQHKCIVSNTSWKLSPIINKRVDRGGKRVFWVEKLISGGTYVRHSIIVTKFRLNLWIKLTQKGYFRTKNMKITIEFYIFILIYNISHKLLRPTQFL